VLLLSTHQFLNTTKIIAACAAFPWAIGRFGI
jgi:hypothetical protein